MRSQMGNDQQSKIQCVCNCPMHTSIETNEKAFTDPL